MQRLFSRNNTAQHHDSSSNQQNASGLRTRRISSNNNDSSDSDEHTGAVSRQNGGVQIISNRISHIRSSCGSRSRRGRHALRAGMSNSAISRAKKYQMLPQTNRQHSSIIARQNQSVRVWHQFDHHHRDHDGDVSITIDHTDSILPADATDQSASNSTQYASTYNLQLRNKLMNVVGCSRGRYRMYLITTLLPVQNDQPLISRVLAKELILRIFSFLDATSLCRCAQTCRLWNMLALDGSNWQHVDLFQFQKDVKAPVVENLARRCGGFLKKLSLRGCENIHDNALRTFTQKCPNIEQLSLYRCKRITDSTCESLGQNCHRLVWLNLENCTTVSDKSLKALSDGCKNLEYLNVSWCENIQDEGIQYLLTGCPRLNTLILRGCDGLSEYLFVGMKEHCKKLRTINLLGCLVIDQTIADLASGCTALECLCLSMCQQITDRAIISLANACHRLKDIELAGCCLITDQGFAQLAKNCHELERMDLEDCALITDNTLDNLSKGCPCIMNLSLSHCELITDAGIRHLCSNQRLKERIAVLELDNCPQITDVCLEYMRQLKMLQQVDLYDCQNISKDAIKRFKVFKPDVEVHAYFAPATPPATTQPTRNAICRCCSIL